LAVSLIQVFAVYNWPLLSYTDPMSDPSKQPVVVPVECRKCKGTEFGSQWVGGGRVLRYYCCNCGWQSAPGTPPQKEIETVKKVAVEFGRFNYTVYDRYGWVIMYARSYDTESEAMEAMEFDLSLGRNDVEAGPYTAVMWPPFAEIQGKVFK
jgi:hypothetical protein